MRVTSVRALPTMTKAEALKIQAEQVAHYAQFRADLPAIVASMTKADELQDGVAYQMDVINRCIPRGGDIERFLSINPSKHYD
jgi:hypothetical protein